MIDIHSVPPSIHRRRQIIVGVFGLLSLFYMLATPIWETPDESYHYAFADYLATTARLPEQDPENIEAWEQEGSQPPLYYIIVASLIAPIDRTEPEQIYNPHTKRGIGLATDNQNLMLHNRDQEAFPWHGAELATLIGRLVSISCAMMTVWLVFRFAYLLIPNNSQVALLAMAFTTFNPMFIFISASMNNDNLVILLGTASMVLLMELWRGGWNWRTITTLAVLLGLAALTKLSGLTFAPIVGLGILLLQRRENRPFTDLVRAGLLIAGGILLIAGWWYARNIYLYGDITGLNVMVEIVGPRPAGFNLNDLWHEREGFFYAFWGWFGVLSVLGPTSLFTIVSGLCIVALVGLVHYLTQRTNSIIWLFVLQFIITFGGLIRWSLQTPASQGRLLFPVIALISTGLALGLFHLQKTLQLPQFMSFLAVVPLAIYAVALPIITIRPAYTPAPPLTELPPDARTVDARYGNIQFLGYVIESEPVIVDSAHTDDLTITLYWQPLAQTDDPLSFFVQVIAPDDNYEPIIVGTLDSYPGRGLRQTDTWEVGQIYGETYHIELFGAHRYTPFEPRIRIGWRDNVSHLEVPATTNAGNPVETVILRGGRVISPCVNDAEDIVAEWEKLVQLHQPAQQDYQSIAGGQFAVQLDWHTIGETPDDYTVFVQVLDDDQNLWGSGDQMPRQNWFPTSDWVEGICFADDYFVTLNEDIPVGKYQLAVGFYRPETGPIFNTNGQTHVIIGSVTVTE